MDKVIIRFKPTKLEFSVDRKYADELLIDEPENFEAVTKGYKPELPPEEPTIYESIVVEEPKEEEKTEEVVIPKRKRNRV